MAEVRAVPRRRPWLVCGVRVLGARNVAGPRRLGVESPELFLTKLLKLVLVEAWELFNAFASEIRNDDVAFAVELRMADRQQKKLRFEPAARVNRKIVRPARNRIDHKSFKFSETISCGAFDIHFIEVHNLIV
jgi:hypothetical protein